MKQEIQGTGTKKTSPREKTGLHVGIRGELSSAASPFPYLIPAFAPVSFPASEYLFFSPGLLQLDLNIYREPMIKALIKEQSEDLYRLIKKVHFDGKYYRVKSVHSGEWEHCWELAVRIQFFGKLQGLAFEPKRVVSGKDKKIIYRSLILVNPHELWDEELVERLWNLQERIEFLIAKILFHECIHVLIFLGKTLPSGFGQTDIFLEFKEILEFANSKKLCPESCGVKSHLQNLADLSPDFPESSGEKLDKVPELYEFLIHEKYSIKKTDQAFGLSWSNRKVSRNYAKMAALKMGSCPGSSKKDWEKEVFRLHRDLKELYDRIDDKRGSAEGC
ncbi:hypothetical protein EO98_15580 [Methanosarcina sp. 2.H.T.1A.6]|uniref:hypothetical protein n=1 Tax=unclassified Methanosarcina TaxID=2644672 RepID=UPI0006212263|nr:MULTISPECIES: hypothetical protein [unclassified Methanosarcina]KKG17590.1 hypothetical protein EO94_12005 [Methanosarcina sp. 2.H.T.1A.3]KKG21830.1 hypothetical protein EO98_15580 [Methanosarcina sp. 2.H.T.1A.6]KKG25365.1 hypothetical protein EO96_00030 [Methanosarcina sp. 2.H.T.1A.8]KKG27569.1 hypothetical protein EO97_01220 [Methanosarcina sp. 2.H.T.1A.15]